MRGGAERRGFFGRIVDAVVAWNLDRQIERARRIERSALRILGGALAGSSAVGRLVDEVRSRGHAEDHLQTALRASLEEDRADYATASAWARPFVIVRGIAARAVLRDRVRLARRAREETRERLGKAALDGSVHLSKESFVVDAAARARDARTRLSRLLAEHNALLAPYGGSPLPEWMWGLAREVSGFGAAIARVLREQVVPRVPALVVMAGGFWAASTFTDSDLFATLHSWGVGRGPRWGVSTPTFDALRFWVPIGAAAICGYLGNRVTMRIRARYAPPPSPPQARPLAAAATHRR